MHLHTVEADQESLALICDIRKALCDALTSLEDKPHPAYAFNYIYFLAGNVNRVADGFVVLRQNDRVDASKLLVRPAIEAMFLLTAVVQKPELFYRIAYKEHQDDLKWFRQATRHGGGTFDDSGLVQQWADFSANYKAEFPKHSISETTLSLEEAAIKAGMSGYYDTFYRMYCRYQHVALRAIGQSLDELTDAEDNRAVALCTFAALEALVALGADAPSDFDSLRNRVKPPVSGP
jgi:Family of unknown function (DUF5677)